ncbi:MAG: SDR family oxidoreductase [Bacteroidota bacterium]
MDLHLAGKTAFISGSTSGIGFATAQSLLEEGASVIINGRTQASVQHALSRLKNPMPPAKVDGIAADFSKPEEIQHLCRSLPQIDILINNVGIYHAISFLDTTDEKWQEQFEVNVMSGVRLSRYLLPAMLDKNWGRILFISSECATLVPEDLIAYSMTKTAVLAISRGLAQLTKGTHVTVNAVVPGSTLTEGAEQLLKEMAEQQGKSLEEVETDFFTGTRTSSLLQRFAKVEEIAQTITYLASPRSSATNGASIKVDGGSMGGL